MLQEMIGKVIPKFAEKGWIPGIVLTSGLFTCTWGYLVYTGNIAIIWPLFGMSNQLLAACALIVGTTMIMGMGKMKYSWITGVPGVLMLPVTMTAGYYLIKVNLSHANYLLVFFAASLMTLMVIVFALAFRKWYLLGRQAKTVAGIMPTVR